MIFGKRRERHPLEPISEPIQLSGGRPRFVTVEPAPTLPPPRGAIGPGEDERSFAPHCDQRILHAPGECWACDLYPDWQALRVKWGIAFTGHRPEQYRLGLDQRDEIVAVRRELPCPADYNRPPGSISDHRQWGPNEAQGERT